ncbi:hypothetical protein TUN199_06494 [Pyrenophora tritici-repentis]|uniref:Mg2+ and Co2+ transporter n=1 Tax=Pyrenophora tritici-repentis TaxID=45151 RepID=A0A2W1DSA9_9PLEO|nr:CorA, Mg2+ and Co2+ transporter [Pyrenophora tritici-repentis]KAI0570780.1 CorA Mg2+ and Co2+ transporter [Pyrenophora tritici-repentis]KAI0581765.1 CorA Mg2+ and Co2+ transporter [Pyrenophora tritici-repentis]KAI0609563.1 CorA Mg2+ and Co2+ transporter [Pyrenophora tritici-repentis]KAI0621504.1 hypothetical protein TUN199_06494 [Pyrenophora tritici-repentis]
MDQFVLSCKTYRQYPRNLRQHDISSYNVKSYSDRLESLSGSLFHPNKAAVDFLEYRDSTDCHIKSCVKDQRELELILGCRNFAQPEDIDPRRRCVFLSAGHSRASLRITHDMFSFLCTFFQVNPSFLDFLFPFGRQGFARDFHFSGLRDESRLANYLDSSIPTALGRSGRDIRLCYNLRSVEPCKDHSPWSIRQCAVYHTFDLKTRKTFWIFVKGNKVIKERVTEALERLNHIDTATKKPRQPVHSPSCDEFNTSLEIHLLLCNWSGENWRWYINELEDQLQATTQGALEFKVEKKLTLVTTPSVSSVMSPRTGIGIFRKASWAPHPSRASRFEALSPLSIPSAVVPEDAMQSQPSLLSQPPTRLNTRYNTWSTVLPRDPTKRKKFAFIRPSSLLKSVPWPWKVEDVSNRPTPSDNEKLAPSSNKFPPPQLPPSTSQDELDKIPGTFTFQTLQDIQHIEEKAQEALLHMKLNMEVLTHLRQQYQHFTHHTNFPNEMARHREESLFNFDKGVIGVEKDLRMLESQIETLLLLLNNRKTLVSGMLQHRSSKASEFYAKESRESAARMEEMTLTMQALAVKTTQETVSMRVITTVTLFFLPATFIATFMSTDILKFENDRQDLQTKGLSIYLAISLPLTAFTFFVWYVIYRWAKMKTEARSDKLSEAVSEV